MTASSRQAAPAPDHTGESVLYIRQGQGLTAQQHRARARNSAQALAIIGPADVQRTIVLNRQSAASAFEPLLSDR